MLPVLYSHKEHDAASDARLHLSHLELSTSSSLNILLNDSALLAVPELFLAGF